MSSITRRDLVGLGLGGVVGGAVGHFATKPSAPTPLRNEPKNAVCFSIRGGYGLVRLKHLNDSSKQDLFLVTPNNKHPRCWMEHKLMLIVQDGDGDMDLQSGIAVTRNDKKGLYHATLTGKCSFTSGIPNDAVTWPGKSNPSGEHAPKPHYDDELWDDLAWLHQLGPAPGDLDSRIAAGLRFTGGRLKVMPPENPYGRRGRFVFKKNSGEERHAMTDQVDLTYRTDDASVVIKQEADGKTLTIRPYKDSLKVRIQSLLDLKNMCFEPGKKLDEYISLYTLAGDTPCADRVIPEFEKVKDVELPDCETLTPGDLCPPGYLPEP